jgi:diacylglycerol kinase (ATP)
MNVVIINPVSGTGHGSPEARGRQRAARAEAVLAPLGVPYRIEITDGPHHGADLARRAAAEGASLVCAWGGDGTMNEIAGALAFSTVPLGVIPGGSGNGFARELGISMKPERALMQALQGTERIVDAGEIGGRLFFNVAGLGFDAHVARRFNESGKRRGFVAYLTTSVKELLSYRAASYQIAVGDETFTRSALMVVVANTAQYGNGARVAPQARPDDGRLDLVVVDPGTPLGNMWRARRLFDGSLARSPGVLMREVQALNISGGNGGLWFHVDGEPVHGTPSLDVRVHPRALRVRVPRA